MAVEQLYVNQVVSKIKANYFNGMDYPEVPDGTKLDAGKVQDCEKMISRGLSAFVIKHLTNCSEQEALNSVTDGTEDNGIDAVFYDENSNCLFITQGKYIKSGIGEVDLAAIGKLKQGLEDLISLKFEKFNSRFNDRKNEIRSILEEEPELSVKLLLICTGNGTARDDEGQLIKCSNSGVMDEYVSNSNKGNEWLSCEFITLDCLHNMLVERNTVDEEIALFEYGMCNVVTRSYYGRMGASDIGRLWSQYGSKLFSANIRSLLKRSVVNKNMIQTLAEEPDRFWYYNNGATILCKTINPHVAGGNNRESKVFSLTDISVINGAQTIGSIGEYYVSLPEADRDTVLANTFINVRLIEAPSGAEDFAKKIAINNNMQNRIMSRDFAGQTPLQKRLKDDLAIDGIVYHIVRDRENKSDDSHFDILEAGRARCNALGLKYSLITHRGLDTHLFGRLDKPEYTAVFNDSLTGLLVWNTVRIQRVIDGVIGEIKDTVADDDVIVYGKDFISCHVFDKVLGHTVPNNEIMRIDETKIKDHITSMIPSLVSEVRKIPGTTMNIFKNYKELEQIYSRI